MALFVVNRYLGEDDEANKNSKNNDGLEKLLEKINKRQKLKALEKLNQSDSDSDSSAQKSSGDSPRIKNHLLSSKKKKDELKQRFEEAENEKDVQKNNKKKKKRKKRPSQSDLDDNGIKNDCEIEESFNSSAVEERVLNGTLDEHSLKDMHQCNNDKKKRKISETDFLTAEDNEKEDLTKVKKTRKKQKISDGKEPIRATNNVDNSVSNENKESVSPELLENESIKDENRDSQVSEFTVIGGQNYKHKKAVKWVLPEWLSKPILISGSLKDDSAGTELIKGMDEVLIKNLKKNNIKHFFPVQQQVIPWVLSETQFSGPGLRFWPRDICVSAPTGSGKTLSFVLPIIQRLRKRLVRRIGALVVVPVQDLAAQVAQVFEQYAAGTGLQVLSVTGKKMHLQQEQKLLVYHKVGVGYESLVDIMVTTPGRLVEHMKETPGFSLRNLKFLVIDEADRVIDNIKNDWLYHLENHISSGGIGALPPLSLNTVKQFPLRPHKLLFSATLTQDPEKLKQINLFQPRLFVYKATDCNEMETPEKMRTEDSFTNQTMKPVELEECWIECSNQLKPLIFYHILAKKNWRGVLCFTHFTDATHRLTRLLHHLSSCHGLNLTIAEISSERSFNDRHKILNDFRAGIIDVLVCSDVYARGMDILEVRYVVLYSPPVHTRNYIHQVGRTARAGMKGTALTLLTPPQVKSFHKMLKSTGHSDLKELKITEKDLVYLGKPYKKALRSLKKETMREKESSKEQAKMTKRKNFIQHKRTIKKDVNTIGRKKIKSNLKEIKLKKVRVKKINNKE